VHRPAAFEWLIVPIRVEGESTKQGAIGRYDPDLGAGDQEEDFTVAVGGADRNVAQLAEVAQSDLALGIDAILTDPVVSGCFGLRGPGLEACVEGDQRGPPAQRPGEVGGGRKVDTEIV